MTDQGSIPNERQHEANPLVSDPRIIDIRNLSACDLEPALLEETAEWSSELDWDFSKSADLVRKFADAHRLTGAALLHRGEISGYGYTGLEGNKGSIWDVYVRPRWRDGNSEQRLLCVLLDALIGCADVCRIESQLMLVEPASAQALQRGHLMRLFERLLMALEANTTLPPGRESVAQRFRLESWNDGGCDAAAKVISLAYAGHVDAEINEHYRTARTATRFVYNLVQFPGCAAFHQPASYLAFDLATGQIAGISLSSFIAKDVAHIAELCIVPRFQGIGLGYELLRRSIEMLRNAGAKRISVTVTASNLGAVRLYTRCGFRQTRLFYAYVWERY